MASALMYVVKLFGATDRTHVVSGLDIVSLIVVARGVVPWSANCVDSGSKRLQPPRSDQLSGGDGRVVGVARRRAATNEKRGKGCGGIKRRWGGCSQSPATCPVCKETCVCARRHHSRFEIVRERVFGDFREATSQVNILIAPA